MANAKRYKKRKPKYMELYSRNPPAIAPSRLDDKADGNDGQRLISVENTIPEKKTGTVRRKGARNQLAPHDTTV